MRRTLFALMAFLSLAATAQAGLIHQYTFNDGTANDYVGGAHGVAVHNPGFVGGQLVFDPTINNGVNADTATGQYVQLPAHMGEHRNVSIEFWGTYNGGNNWQRVVSFGNTNNGAMLPGEVAPPGTNGKGFMMMAHNGWGNLIGQISIDSWGNPVDTNFIPAGEPMPLGQEAHVVFTHDPDAGVQAIYINGVLLNTRVADVDPSTADWPNSFIGRSQFERDPFFHGSINELNLYDHALSLDEVLAHFENGPVPYEAPAVPEPATLGLWAALAGVGAVSIRRKRRA